MHGALTLLFDTLNTEPKKRAKNLPEHLAKFPYINGALFQGGLSPCYFDEATHNTLIECANLDWSDISPAIFGSLFQAVMHDEEDTGKAKTKKRREFGAHYTSEQNILKTIKPLFMDDLWEEFEKIPKTYQTKLATFHQKLAKLKFFDPACGCGNFLIIAYRELRLLELEVIKRQCGKRPTDKQIQSLILCDVDQFYGIDIDESAVEIAKVAMWLTDHQVNLKVQELGVYYNRIPLNKKANIVHANALQLDWQSVIKPKDCSFIMGNPPFVGHQWRNTEQMRDMDFVWGDKGKFGRLDFVTCWHKKATDFIKNNPNISVAFVSTNSICQGEQVGILWAHLLAHGIKIHFAHRTFRWSNDGRGVAAVHCVIIGFGLKEPSSYRLFDYEDIKGEPTEIKATQINPYLVDAPNVILPSRIQPPAGLPQVKQGSKPVDNGNFLFNDEEKNYFLIAEPKAEKWIRPYLGGDELINGNRRWCLWLKEISPSELKQMPQVIKRVQAVADARLKSPTQSVKDFALRPYLFTQDRQPETNYLAIPEVSSEIRRFIPIGYFDSNTIASNKLLVIPEATLYHFGILCSTMHNSWMRAVAGRLESRYSYAPAVYNNFPFPTPTAKQIAAIEKQAQAVLDARAIHENSTLADLYNPLTMPANLVKAHNELDKAVDSAYSFTGKKDDAARVAFLFLLYQKLSAPAIEPENEGGAILKKRLKR